MNVLNRRTTNGIGDGVVALWKDYFYVAFRGYYVFSCEVNAVISFHPELAAVRENLYVQQCSIIDVEE